MLTAVNIFNFLKYGLSGLFLMIDGIVYWAISNLFALYEALAGAEIITQDTYQEIANKFYVVIGVAMLFYVAYALLKSLVNPDEAGKNLSKIVTNIIISIVLLGVTPTIFSTAFELQRVIMKDHVIDNLIFGNNDNSVGKKGNRSAMNVLNAFLNNENNDVPGESGKYWLEFKSEIGEEGSSTSFMDVTDFAESVHNGDISYVPIVSTICGCFLAYVLLSFCLDLGIRVVKLAFYQIIAPIPILMRIVPEKKSVFDNWVKGSLAAYLEVFTRLFIMYIIIFLVSEVFNGKVSLWNSDIGPIGSVIIILGLFAFAKEAPKLIGNVLGIDSGNIKLGIGGKLAAGGAIGAAALLGGGATSLIRGASSRWYGKNNWKNKDGEVTIGSVTKNVGRGLLSAFAGGASGAARSAKGGFAAKNFADLRKAAGEGASGAEDARIKRDKYLLNHGGTLGGAMLGHLKDTGKSVGEWAGINYSLKGLQEIQKNANEVKNARKAVDDRLTSILNKYKDSMTTAGNKVKAEIDIDGYMESFAEFDNYGTLLYELEVMKSTGKMSDGRTATSDMITAMSQAEFKLKEQMKKEILQGFDLRNKAGQGVTHKFADEKEFKQFYDGELQSLVTDFRTKALHNSDVISQNVDTKIFKKELDTYLQQAVTNQAQKDYDFIVSNNIGALFEDSKDAISNATSTIDNMVSKKYQEEAQKKNS